MACRSFWLGDQFVIQVSDKAGVSMKQNFEVKMQNGVILFHCFTAASWSFHTPLFESLQIQDDGLHIVMNLV